MSTNKGDGDVFDADAFIFDDTDGNTSPSSSSDDGFDWSDMPETGSQNSQSFASLSSDDGFDDEEGEYPAFDSETPASIEEKAEDFGSFTGSSFDNDFLETSDRVTSDDQDSLSDDEFIVSDDEDEKSDENNDEDDEDEEFEEFDGSSEERSLFQKLLFPVVATVFSLGIIAVTYPVLSSFIFGSSPGTVSTAVNTSESSLPWETTPSSNSVSASLPAATAPISAQPALPLGTNNSVPSLPSVNNSAFVSSEPASVGVGTSAVFDTKFLEDRIKALEEEIAVYKSMNIDILVSRVASLESKLAAQPAASGTPRPSVEPPSKPIISSDWLIRGIEGDVAWIEGPGGFLEVSVGTEIDNFGVVENITKYENSWVVVTTAGLISQ